MHPPAGATLGQRCASSVHEPRISISRVPSATETFASPFSLSSTIQNCSPALKVWLERELELAVEYVPLPNFGLSPKKTFTVFEQELLMSTESVLGLEGVLDPLLGVVVVAVAPGVAAPGVPAAGAPAPAAG